MEGLHEKGQREIFSAEWIGELFSKSSDFYGMVKMVLSIRIVSTNSIACLCRDSS